MPTIAERVAEIYRAEEAAQRKVLTRADVPARYEAITPQWLTDVLCREVPGAAVVNCRVGDFSNGSSNRARIYVSYNDVGARAALPATVFCKSSTTLANRTLLANVGVGQAESNFFNKVRSRLDMEAPQPVHAAFDPDTYAYVVVMKDMGGTVDFCTHKSTIDRKHAESLVDTLARLHARFYQSAELGTAALPFKTWYKWWEDNLKATADYEQACDTGFGAAEALIPVRLFKRRSDIWPATMRSAELHRQLPHTLIHCDVHLANWYVAADGRMGLGDWHCTSIGHWSRDFAYAIGTALTVEDRRRWDMDLLRLYLKRMAEYGAPKIDFDEAFRNVRQQSPSALAFWTITLRPAKGMPDMQPESTSYEFVKRLATAVDDWEALDA